MPRTLEELDAEVTRLAAEVEALKKGSNGRHPLEEVAGRFTHDETWDTLFAEIERQRHIPDPELAAYWRDREGEPAQESFGTQSSQDNANETAAQDTFLNPEQMAAELTRVRREVEELKAMLQAQPDPWRRFEGCFTGDERLTNIHEEIERHRRVPNTDFTSQ